MKHIYGIEDVRGEDGQWIKSYYTFDEKGEKVCMRTRAGFLWQDIQKRCSPRNWETKYPTYTGCQNLFESFNAFTEWCQHQYGYLNKTNDRFWSIDKDMLVPGSNQYSIETCMFVPCWLNNIVVDNKRDRGDQPLGVHWSNNKNAFISQVNNERGFITLGRFKDSTTGHKAWQVAKAEYLWRLCDEDPVLQEHHLAREALQNISDRIYSEWLFEKETKSVLKA